MNKTVMETIEYLRDHYRLDEIIYVDIWSAGDVPEDMAQERSMTKDEVWDEVSHSFDLAHSDKSQMNDTLSDIIIDEVPIRERK